MTEIEQNDFMYVLKQVYSYCIDIGFIFLPLIGYIAQYLKIKKLKSSYGFSKFISFILIVAFIFRIFYYIGKPFKKPILYQAIVGFIMQMILIFECIKYTDYSHKTKNDYFRINDFWDWPYYNDYFFCISSLIILLSVMSNFIGFRNEFYVDLLGGISVSVESMLGIPQVLANYRTKNVKNLSFLLIATWFLGDAFKTYYYISEKEHLPFIFCGISQLTVDVVIILQMLYYNKYYQNLADAT
jgi:uncharacterized protein with PQ loop repeat